MLLSGRQYASGGALDSQTTDSQFVRDLVSSWDDGALDPGDAAAEGDMTLIGEHCSSV
ncbi:hypothetical protein OH77DRAFT_1427953, partial [Trametes cingulata]